MLQLLGFQMFPGSGTHSSNDTLAEITNTRWIKAGYRHLEHHHPAQHNKARALKIHLLKFMTHLSRLVHISRKLSYFSLVDSHLIFLELQDIHPQLVLFFIQINLPEHLPSLFSCLLLSQCSKKFAYSFSLSASVLQPSKKYLPSYFKTLAHINFIRQMGKHKNKLFNFYFMFYIYIYICLVYLFMQTLKKLLPVPGHCMWQCKCTLHKCRRTICKGDAQLCGHLPQACSVLREVSLEYSSKGRSEVHLHLGSSCEKCDKNPKPSTESEFLERGLWMCLVNYFLWEF